MTKRRTNMVHIADSRPITEPQYVVIKTAILYFRGF